MMSNARTLLCAVPQPVADERKTVSYRRFLHFTLVAGLMAGLQGLTAGPAAVATLPSALLARPMVAPTMKPVVTASMDFTPKLGKEPGLFQAILDGAFSFVKPRAMKPAPESVVDEAASDPDELIPFNGRTVPRWLVHSILKAAHVTGVDPVYMMTLADVESSLSPEAKAPTSSAQGLFQFIDSTWIETVYHHAEDYGFAAAAEAISYVNGELEVETKSRDWVMSLRTDPYFSALMAGELIKDVERALQAVGERELAEAELYLAHFLGASSAVRFLEVLDQDPNMKASKLFPKAARANAGLFMEGKGRKRRPVSVAELYDKIDSKIVRRLDRYEGIGPYLAEIARPAERTAEASALAQ
jgi:Transglycosylase SLT domain